MKLLFSFKLFALMTVATTFHVVQGKEVSVFAWTVIALLGGWIRPGAAQLRLALFSHSSFHVLRLPRLDHFPLHDARQHLRFVPHFGFAQASLWLFPLFHTVRKILPSSRPAMANGWSSTVPYVDHRGFALLLRCQLGRSYHSLFHNTSSSLYGVGFCSCHSSRHPIMKQELIIID